MTSKETRQKVSLSNWAKLIKGKEVLIQMGDGGESTSYFQGTVEKVFLPSRFVKQPVIVIEETGQEVPLMKGITNVSVLGQS